MRRTARRLLYRAIMPGSWEGQYIRLQVISGQNINVPSSRIPAGTYVSIKIDETRRWNSAVRVLSSDISVAWGDTVTLLPDMSPSLTLEIRASFELSRMLGHGELIGQLKTSWNDLRDHGDEPFDLSFPPIRGVCPSLTLKAASVHACSNDDGDLFDCTIDCEAARDTDAGHARVAEYTTSKMVSHLNDAVERFQLVLDRCPIGHPDHATALTNLAFAQLAGYVLKDFQDIESTTSLFHDAHALRPQDHPDRPLTLFYLTQALRWRHNNQHTTPADIWKSVQLCHQLLPLCPEGTYLHSIAVGNSGVDYVIFRCNNLPIDASDEGTQLRRIVVELCPLGHQYRLSALNKLSLNLRARFAQYGSIDDLDESIQCCREIVSLAPKGCHGHDAYLNNLAILIAKRFDHQAKSHDLDEAISLYEEALRLCPVGHCAYRFARFDNLGRALCTRFGKCGDTDDINRAISLHREALTLCPPGHPGRDTPLNNLAIALTTRHGKLHISNSEDLNEAIDSYRESLRLKKHDHPERHVTLNNLSSALRSRFTKTLENEDIEEAINLCQQSLATLPPLHPDRFFSYGWLHEAYLFRYRTLHNPADLSLAIENMKLASRHPTQSLRQRIMLSSNWTVAAEQHGHGSALEAYTAFFELHDAYLATRSSIISRREAAAAFQYATTLPANAASCAIRHHDLQKAVELVEQGRGQQWSLASRLRTPLEDLESTNPQLARNFSELSELISNAAEDSAAITDRAAADQAAVEYRRLTTRWEATAGEIRNLQGFSRFLLPPSYEELQVAARHGPVIILNASKYSCDALIVPTSGQPYHVPFPSVTLTDLEMLKKDFAREIRHAGLMGPTEPRKDLRVILRKIWDVIMLPIVDVLQHDLKLRRRSRIWLCPTAAFTSIPLHAAHPFRTKADRFWARIIPRGSLHLLLHANAVGFDPVSTDDEEPCASSPSRQLGKVSQVLGKARCSPMLTTSLSSSINLFPPTSSSPIYLATRLHRQVHLMLCDATPWVHLACHGKQDHEQPYHSRFAMRDKPLKLLDIMENNAPQAEFAFLSACHTAVGDEETPDEVIHLAAGLQFSGFKSVIGTLWAVDDAVAKHVVEAFYHKMFENLEDGDMDCTKAALALNHATRTVPKKEVPLEQRMVFIHIGV
ncbi:CHAT domain-containing protein [Suillus paluster]|uniref:CHAT domain-containing protein n=1 Tax=Suillus paluster TaxID=48578 RepID=UPI001B860B8B|nr:CHAT domain-containing protein [Suillus paluster]KAG1730513.1 CHAT domain-containing protein [Suillus paluster]